jgi:hypothetical protein
MIDFVRSGPASSSGPRFAESFHRGDFVCVPEPGAAESEGGGRTNELTVRLMIMTTISTVFRRGSFY